MIQINFKQFKRKIQIQIRKKVDKIYVRKQNILQITKPEFQGIFLCFYLAFLIDKVQKKYKFEIDNKKNHYDTFLNGIVAKNQENIKNQSAMLRSLLKLDQQKDRMLQQLQTNYEQQNSIKQTIKTSMISINNLIQSTKNDPQMEKSLYQHLVSQVLPLLNLTQISAKILQQQMASQQLTLMIEDLQFQDSQTKKQTIEINKQNESIQLQTQQINSTITNIKSSIKQLVSTQQRKIAFINQHFNKSFQDIQNKIILFEKQSVAFEKDNELLKQKKKSIQQKLNRLQTDYKKQSEQKDSNVKIQKDQLIQKLQSLQIQVSEVTQLNKDYSAKEKSNFDKKLSLYLKVKKFPQYSSSFLNSAKTIEQCKQQLLKGIQRMNDANETLQRYQNQTEEINTLLNNELNKKAQRQAKIESLKKQKEVVRDKIITLQNKIKEQKLKVNDNVQ